jgi:hypothetical protein
MNICYILHGLSNSDIILIITAVILFVTLIVIQKGNMENVGFNRLQAAGNTIMKQIEFHNNLLKGISINFELTGRGFGTPNAPVVAYGQDAFKIFYEDLEGFYKDRKENYNDTIIDEDKRIRDSYNQLYDMYPSQLGNYFKNLYLIVFYIDYINSRKIEGFNKDYYISLIKAQLSKYEILLLAYNCIWIQHKAKPEGKNFIEFAKTYNLLSALETGELIESVSSVQHIDIFKNLYGITF